MEDIMFDLHTVDFEKIIAIIKEASVLFKDDAAAAAITEKGASDYVTEVDTSVQKFLSEKLTALYPDIQLMGEEKDNSDIDVSRPVWILDPVDGTTNLIHRFPGSSISLGLAADNNLVAGIVYSPYHDEVFFATKGGGAFLNGKPIHVRNSKTLSESLISCGTAPYWPEHADQVFDIMKRVFLRAHDIRRIGSSALELSYVACGRLDAFFELLLKPWDFAAAWVILTEAGGKLTDYDGNEITPYHPAPVVGTNGWIHEELLSLINE